MAGLISPDIYRALAIASALEFYQRTGKRINRAYTPLNMMGNARAITGKTFAARDYQGAADALRDWAQNRAMGERNGSHS